MKNKKGDFSKIIIATLLATTICFVVVVLWLFKETGSEPSTLILSYFGLITGEFGFLATIKKKKVDTKYNKETENESD